MSANIRDESPAQYLEKPRLGNQEQQATSMSQQDSQKVSECESPFPRVVTSEKENIDGSQIKKHRNSIP